MKGVEARLPDGARFIDAITGQRRHAVRLAWWEASNQLWDCALPMPGCDVRSVPNVTLSPEHRPQMSDQHVHFVGHYWMTGAPAPLWPNAASVDYSGAEGLPVTAYRWEGEPVLDASRFVQAF